MKFLKKLPHQSKEEWLLFNGANMVARQMTKQTSRNRMASVRMVLEAYHIQCFQP